jgi:hypothetical protein
LLINTGSLATSHVSGAGGAGTTIQAEIADGTTDESFGQGFGLGKFGVGRFGVSKTSSAGRTRPRLWFFDRFGDRIILTPGNQTGVYEWDGVTTAAPALVSGAPTAVSYAFVSDEILVTLGRIRRQEPHQGIRPRRPHELDIEQHQPCLYRRHRGRKRIPEPCAACPASICCSAKTRHGRSVSSACPMSGKSKIKDPKIGIIAPLARIVVGGIPYWMGQKNFYMWRGGNVEKIPSNLSIPESSILKICF